MTGCIAPWVISSDGRTATGVSGVSYRKVAVPLWLSLPCVDNLVKQTPFPLFILSIYSLPTRDYLPVNVQRSPRSLSLTLFTPVDDSTSSNTTHHPIFVQRQFSSPATMLALFLAALPFLSCESRP